VLAAYRQHVAERSAEGIDPKPLNAEQVNGLIELLKAPPPGEEAFILDLITNRVPPGDRNACAHACTSEDSANHRGQLRTAADDPPLRGLT